MDHTDWYPQQPDGSSYVWRYMDLPKYISLLDNEELWFSNTTKFEDPYEGASSQQDIHNRVAPQIPDPGDTTEEWLKNFMNKHAIDTVYRVMVRRATYMNCWHLNPHQSIAMWDRYSDQGKGIVVRSTIDKFAESIEGVVTDSDDSPEDIPIRRGSQDLPIDRESGTDLGDPRIPLMFGKVNYVDYVNDTTPSSLIAPYFHKRNGYASEKEFRAVIMKSVHKDKLVSVENGGISPTDWVKQLPDGIRISVDLDTLIDSVYVAPDAPKLFYDSVESVSRKLGGDINLEEYQPLDREPIF